jgi:hypothetical protein
VIDMPPPLLMARRRLGVPAQSVVAEVSRRAASRCCNSAGTGGAVGHLRATVRSSANPYDMNDPCSGLAFRRHVMDFCRGNTDWPGRPSVGDRLRAASDSSPAARSRSLALAAVAFNRIS